MSRSRYPDETFLWYGEHWASDCAGGYDRPRVIGPREFRQHIIAGGADERLDALVGVG